MYVIRGSEAYFAVGVDIAEEMFRKLFAVQDIDDFFLS